jgi:hypothetical protein
MAMTEIDADRKNEIIRRHEELKRGGMSDDDAAEAVQKEFSVDRDALDAMLRPETDEQPGD